MRKYKILYIVNFYGTPPLNYLERYIKEKALADLTILKLPSVRPMKNRLLIDAFIVKPDGTKHESNIDIFFPLPNFVVYIVQYFINFIMLFYLLKKSKIKKFDIGIGETSFGSASIWLLQKLGEVNFTVYMNGDILPPKNMNETFYFTQGTNAFKYLRLLFDKIAINFQYILRNAGMKCDLIWYVTEKIQKWDIANGYKAKNFFLSQVAFIDQKDFEKYSKIKKVKNTLGYIGRLDESAGLDIVISALPLVQKKIPDIKFEIVGGGTASVEHYKAFARKNHAEEYINFHGYVPQMEDAYKILATTSLGMALYSPSKSNVSLYTDASKVKEYLKLGLPVLITKNGPDIEKDVKKYEAGIAVEYDKNIIAKEIIRILKHFQTYEKLKKGVIKLAKDLEYSKHLDNIWHEIIRAYKNSPYI